MATKNVPATAAPAEKTAEKPAPATATATATQGRKGIGKPVVIDENSPSRGGLDIVMAGTPPVGPANS